MNQYTKVNHMDYQSFLSWLSNDRNLSPTTVVAYASDMAIFSRFMDGCGKSTAAEVDRSVIASFIENLKHSSAGRRGKPGLSDARIARLLAVVSSFLDYTRATTLPDLRNPIKEMKRKNRKKRECKAVDEDILGQLDSGITVLRDKAMFALYLSTGLRLVELQQLNRDTIKFERRVNERGAEVFSGSGEVIGKGSKLRKFYVGTETIPISAQYLATRTDDHPALFLSERKGRISTRAIQYTLSAWCLKLGLPHIHPHQLRHSYATRLANAGINEMQLKDLMGHNDFNTTLGYFKIREERIAAGYFSAMEIYRPTPR
jgi:site-specific recombinase XerC